MECTSAGGVDNGERRCTREFREILEVRQGSPRAHTDLSRQDACLVGLHEGEKRGADHLLAVVGVDRVLWFVIAEDIWRLLRSGTWLHTTGSVTDEEEEEDKERREGGGEGSTEETKRQKKQIASSGGMLGGPNIDPYRPLEGFPVPKTCVGDTRPVLTRPWMLRCRDRKMKGGIASVANVFCHSLH